MAKYDEFGRPIYETAEEYNRAHKRGNTSHTYDSPEGSAYKHNSTKNTYSTQSSTRRSTVRTEVQKSSSAITKLAIVMFFCIFGVLIGFSVVKSSYSENFEVYEEVINDVEDGYVEYEGDERTPLPDGFETFSYNGQTYSLPTTVEEIDKMGFEIETEYERDELISTEYEESLFLIDENGVSAGMISVRNYTEDEIAFGKCEVTYFYVSNPVAFGDSVSIPDFEFGNGFSFESSYEELEAYFGVPYYHYASDSDEEYSYDTYQWSYYGDGEYHYVCISFWNGMISDVGIAKSMDQEY